MTTPKYFDIKPPVTNRLENWRRWMNKMETELRQLSYYKKIKVEVKYD